MILSCPACNARYLVKSGSIGLEGRMVKCAKCSHQWFQDPDDEGEEVDLSALSKVLQDEDQDYENDIRVPDIDAGSNDDTDNYQNNNDGGKLDTDNDIPDSVKPISDDDNDDFTRNPNLPAFADDVKRKRGIGGYVGFSVAFILFCGLLGYVFGSKNVIIKQYPASAGFYKLVGFDVPVAGEGLIIERASAKIIEKDDAKILKISGTILNLKDEAVLIPKIVAKLKSSTNNSSKPIDIKMISSVKEKLSPDETYKFIAEYDGSVKEFDSVNISFAVEL